MKEPLEKMQKSHQEHTYLIRGALLMILLLGAIHSLSYSGNIVDDAYITFRYAENLAMGQGLSYNPPLQQEGYSNLLMVLFGAGAVNVGISPVTAARVLGFISFIMVIYVSHSLFEELHRKTLWSLYAPLAIALTSSMAFWSSGGLETITYSLLILGAVYFTAIHWSSPKELTTGKQAFFILMCGLLTLTRTEGAFFALAIAVSPLIKERICPGEAPVDTLIQGIFHRLALGTFLFSVLYHGFRFFWFGTLSSGPSMAKLAGSIHPFTKGLSYGADFLITGIPVLFVMALFFSMTRPNPLTVPMVLLLGGETIIVLIVGGDWMVFHRFFVPFIPLLAIESGGLLLSLWEELPSMRAPVMVLAFFSLSGFLWVPEATQREIECQRAKNALTINMSRDLAKTYGEKTTLLLGDIGIAGYVTGFEIIDMKGLVTPWITRTYRIEGEGNHLRTTLDTDLLLNTHPSLILVAIKSHTFSKEDMEQAAKNKPVDLKRVTGYWSCDTSILKNTRLQKEYHLVKQYKSLPPLNLDYIIFERKSEHRQNRGV